MLEILDSIIATAAVVLALSLVVQAVLQIVKQGLNLKSTYMYRELVALFSSGKELSLSSSLTRALRWQLQESPKWVSKTVDVVLAKAPTVGWKIIDLIPDAVQPLPIRALKAEDEEAYDIVGQLAEKVKGLGYKDLDVLENVKSEDLKKMITSLPMFVMVDPEKDTLDSLRAVVVEAQKTHEDAVKRKSTADIEASKITVQKALQKLNAFTRLPRVLNDIETWFDLTKKAFQEHYERRMKFWSVVLSALVVMAVNADVVDIYQEFARNKPRRDAVTAAMPELMKKVEVTAKKTSHDSAMSPSEIDSIMKRNDRLIKSLLADSSFALIRWNTPSGDPLRYDSSLRGNFAIAVCDFWDAFKRNILGWLGMTLLVSLGAPFWYDLLKTVMGVKETLKRKKESV